MVGPVRGVERGSPLSNISSQITDTVRCDVLCGHTGEPHRGVSLVTCPFDWDPAIILDDDLTASWFTVTPGERPVFGATSRRLPFIFCRQSLSLRFAIPLGTIPTHQRNRQLITIGDYTKPSLLCIFDITVLRIEVEQALVVRVLVESNKARIMVVLVLIHREDSRVVVKHSREVLVRHLLLVQIEGCNGDLLAREFLLQ